MQCPRCDGQGEIQLMQIKSSGTLIQVCDECEAMWLDGDQPSIDAFQDFGTHLQSIGLQGLWSDVDAVELDSETKKDTDDTD